MNDAEDLIKELEKPETKEVMKKIVNENIKKEDLRNDKIKALISNIDYIKWLIDFTKDKKGFSDTDWLYSSEELSDTDQENVDNLELLFEGIYRYAKNNYIYSIPSTFGEYYRIKIDNIGFEIGYLSGQGTMFYCKRILVENDKQFIDFMDIVNNKKQDNVYYIRNNLENLSYMVIDLYNKGIPIEAISETINKAIKHVITNEREKENNKVLKKI